MPLKRSDMIRKCLFVYYTVKPFRLSLVKHHALNRLKSLVKQKNGMRIIDLAVSYDCNLTCAHCSAGVLKTERTVLTLDDYRSIVKQAESLDNLSFNITGGEPLLWSGLHDLIPILKPEKHYISIQTNGMLLSQERAQTLAHLGVNCITTSLDSPHRDTHNRFRGSMRSYDAVLHAIRHAKSAGMQVLVGTTVTHANLRSKDLERLIQIVNGLGAICLFNLAVPCGNWEGNNRVVLRGSDREYLRSLMDRFPGTSTDHEPGRNGKGCPASMEKLYITPYGDVLPCPFMHISFGNIRKETLKDVVLKMRNNPYLKGYPGICVAAEDYRFQLEVISKLSDRADLPVDYRAIFNQGIDGETRNE